MKKERIDLEKGDRTAALASLKRYFREERNEELGDLAVQLVLDYIAEEIGPRFYNQGVRDAAKFLGERLEDLSALEKIV